ncbi:MAG: phospho-sugar mutase [Puniceicoccales bacterium]|jgi:phosphoglucomutase|nr:phospho-sugar mutase [Puniceicoccales bacterium]
MTDILAHAAQARATGQLLAVAHDNLSEWILAGFLPPWAQRALAELVAQGEWEELNDRFFKKLSFGTGGIRGLTIGRVSAPAERGQPTVQGTPAHPAVGSNNLNDFTLALATAGFYRHVAKAARAPARLVIAHDVRHFSRHFCELAASIWVRLGGEAYIFDGPRSTPQLSHTVRHLRAHAGIVITASHNPPPYNGFKCYLNDGAQVVPPDDAGIVAQVGAVRLSEIPPLLEKDLAAILPVPATAEEAYLARLNDNILDKDIIARARPSVVYTNLHGTGDVMILPALARLGASVTPVAIQREHDPRFPTVQSPNPENAEALTHALAEARRVNADIALATDPDDDRVGAAVRDRDGTYRILTGNTIGSALAAYRIAQMKTLGILPADGSTRATLLKTFVTTQLQDAIARRENIRCVNTLTGFKWIGAKLRQYQARAERALPAGTDYDTLPWAERAALQLRHSTFFVFGGEESYGYLGTDDVRDKDGNAAAVMLVELAAWLKGRNLTFGEYLDDIYLHCGYHAEELMNLALEGATGAARIRGILDSLRTTPPREVDGTPVVSLQDFATQAILDDDRELVPREEFYFFTLADGRRFAVRGSGTEPKIKFYLFVSIPVKNADELASAKTQAASALRRLRRWLESDAERRGRA